MNRGFLRVLLISTAFDPSGGILSVFLSADQSIHIFQILLLFAASVINNIGDFSSIKYSYTKVLAFFAFFLLFIIYSSFNVSIWATEYAKYKNELLLWNLCFLFLTYTSINSVKELRLLIYFSIIQIVISFITNGIDFNTISRTGAGEPIFAGRVGGLLMLYAIFLFSQKVKIISIGLFLFGLIIVFLTGVRTAILAVAFSGIVYIVLQYKRKAVQNIMVFGGLFSLAMYLVISFQLIDIELSNRILGVFRNVSGYESIGRVELFDLAIRTFIERPIFGNGTGSFGFFATGSDSREYPHNIVLELLCEYGIFGTILFSLAFVEVIRMLKLTKSMEIFPLICSVIVYATICSFTSLELPNQFLLFQAFSLVLLAYKSQRKQAQLSEI